VATRAGSGVIVRCSCPATDPLCVAFVSVMPPVPMGLREVPGTDGISVTIVG
jgi:hypothetical protein